MFANIFSDWRKDLKQYYIKLLLFLAPFIIISSLIHYPVQLFSDQLGIVLWFSLFLIQIMAIDFVFVLGFYKVKYLTENNAASPGIFLEISVEFFQLLKMVFKKVVITYSLLYVFFIGLYFMVKWYIAYPLYIFDKSGDPFDKSEKMVKGRGPQIFAILFLGFVIPFILAIVGILQFQKLVVYVVYSQEMVVIWGHLISIIFYPLYVLLKFEVYKFLNENYKESREYPIQIPLSG